MWLVDAFDEHNRAIALGGAAAAADRIALDRLLRHNRAATPARPHGAAGSACWTALRRAAAAHGASAASSASAASLASSALGDAVAGIALRHARARRPPRRHFAGLLPQRFDRAVRRSRPRRPPAIRRPSLRAWRSPSGSATLSTVAIRSLPAPARIAPMAASSAAPGTSRLPATIRIRPLRLLVAVDDRRQRMCVERSTGELHRVPAIASGAEVLGAPSASSGAP